MDNKVEFGKRNIIVGEAKPPTQMFLQYIEKQATAIRQRAQVGLLDRLDPKSLKKVFGIKFVTLEEMSNAVPSETIDAFKSMTAKDWSGCGLEMPNGTLIVMLNPNMTMERTNVTIMEEISHKHLKHQPSKIITLPGGLTQRVYNQQVEQQAYWTAGATLLPALVIAQAVWKRETAAEVALKYGASVELVEMRIRILGFWWEYQNNLNVIESIGTAEFRRS